MKLRHRQINVSAESAHNAPFKHAPERKKSKSTPWMLPTKPFGQLHTERFSLGVPPFKHDRVLISAVKLQFYVAYTIIKTQGSVPCGPRKRGVHAQC